MTKYQLTKYASEIATQIVVAKMGNTTISPSEGNGNNVATFYNEIFNGILSAFGKTELLDDNQ